MLGILVSDISLDGNIFITSRKWTSYKTLDIPSQPHTLFLASYSSDSRMGVECSCPPSYRLPNLVSQLSLSQSGALPSSRRLTTQFWLAAFVLRDVFIMRPCPPALFVPYSVFLSTNLIASRRSYYMAAFFRRYSISCLDCLHSTWLVL